MKTLQLLLLTVCVAARVHGQGTVNFANLAAGVNAPIDDGYGTKLSGPFFVAQLWAGPTANSLAAVSNPIAFSTAVPGYFLGASRVVPTVPTGSSAFFQVRVWANPASYPTWEAVVAAFGSGDPGAAFCFNNMNYDNPLGPALSILQTPPLGGGPVTPPNLVGLTSFHFPTPEPSVIALGILCGSALLLCRRRS